MKFLLILITLTSCALPSPIPRNNKNKSSLYQEKIKKCTLELIGKYGVEAEKSVKVCRDIYKAKQ